MGSLMTMIYLNKTDCDSGTWRDSGRGREKDKDKYVTNK